MSIDPQGKLEGLKKNWQIAAVDIPVPADLVDPKDGHDWARYINCLSLAQKIRKLGQALDQFHDLLGKTADPMTLSDGDQIALYSKWMAAELAASSVSRNFFFFTERRDTFVSELDEGLFCLVDFLKNVRSPDVQVWEERQARHSQIDRGTFTPFQCQRWHLKTSNKKPSGPAAP